jgi:hypothetical protein
VKYVAAILLVLFFVGFAALGVIWVRSMRALHRPFRMPRTRGGVPPSDEEIRVYRKFQRDTSWLGPGSVPPDPPSDPES